MTALDEGGNNLRRRLSAGLERTFKPTEDHYFNNVFKVLVITSMVVFAIGWLLFVVTGTLISFGTNPGYWAAIMQQWSIYIFFLLFFVIIGLHVVLSILEQSIEGKREASTEGRP
ncbi:MAG: hypothetical protein HYV26_06425 [Candidatus Hydrogenedentes bacterium]|nr:hypothetical protein [Candidatus Hydrogenedentota bacterium]